MKPHLRSSAPGKLVLSGEYMVLLGAPAMVIAVDRRAECLLEPSEKHGLTVHSLPFDQTETVMGKTDVPRESTHSLHRLIALFQSFTDVPTQARLTLDTRGFFEKEHKLGIGSSAALIVALSAMFDTLNRTSTPFDSLRRIHNEFQENEGSGLDLAASISGGALRFQNGNYKAIRLPVTLQFCFVFAGGSTNTAEMVRRFTNILRGRYDRSLVREWNHIAEKVADSTAHPNRFVSYINELSDLMFRFDQHTNLGIYSSSHKKARELAQGLGLAYKTCGAGGGDMGVAMGTDATRLKAFENQAISCGLLTQDLGVAEDGVKVERIG